MNREEPRKFPIALLILVLILLIFNFGVTLYELTDYEQRKESGNERWQQVEERIEKLEEACNGRIN